MLGLATAEGFSVELVVDTVEGVAGGAEESEIDGLATGVALADGGAGERLVELTTGSTTFCSASFFTIPGASGTEKSL